MDCIINAMDGLRIEINEVSEKLKYMSDEERIRLGKRYERYVNALGKHWLTLNDAKILIENQYWKLK